MTETFTLAHFSDVHLPPVSGSSWRYWNVKRALGYLNWQRKRRHVHSREMADRLIADAKALRTDHIVITGDLVNLGLPGEYHDALQWLKSVGTPEQVTVIPGNHDIYSSLHGDRGVARWAAYMGAEDGTLAFPFVREVGPLVLIGLNSAVETPPFIASGRLGPQQIDIAAELLNRFFEQDVIRVVLIHHPPLASLASARRGLKDAAHLVRVIEHQGAELVLYGHNHRPVTTWLASHDKPVPLIGAASASAARMHGDEPLASYNLLTFFKTGDRLRIRHVVRGFDEQSGAIVKLSEEILSETEREPSGQMPRDGYV